MRLKAYFNLKQPNLLNTILVYFSHLFLNLTFFLWGCWNVVTLFKSCSIKSLWKADLNKLGCLHEQVWAHYNIKANNLKDLQGANVILLKVEIFPKSCSYSRVSGNVISGNVAFVRNKFCQKIKFKFYPQLSKNPQKCSQLFRHVPCSVIIWFLGIPGIQFK